MRRARPSPNCGGRDGVLQGRSYWKATAQYEGAKNSLGGEFGWNELRGGLAAWRDYADQLRGGGCLRHAGSETCDQGRRGGKKGVGTFRVGASDGVRGASSLHRRNCATLLQYSFLFTEHWDSGGRAGRAVVGNLLDQRRYWAERNRFINAVRVRQRVGRGGRGSIRGTRKAAPVSTHLGSHVNFLDRLLEAPRAIKRKTHTPSTAQRVQLHAQLSS